MDKGFEIARVPIRPCRCGSDEWEVIVNDRQCRSCGTIYTVVEEVERTLNADGIIERVHTHVERPLDDPDDRRVLIRINTGRDDQRPNHDPEADIYRPIMVAQHLSGGGDSVYSYLTYCGKCRRQWGSLGAAHNWIYCPHCSARIGNYVFADGLEHWRPDGYERPPEVWETI